MVEQISEAPQCKHHWRIKTPQGELSEGTCEVCGDKKMFRNYARYSPGEGHYATRGKRDFGSLLDTSSRILGPRLNKPIPGKPI